MRHGVLFGGSGVAERFAEVVAEKHGIVAEAVFSRFLEKYPAFALSADDEFAFTVEEGYAADETGGAVAFGSFGERSFAFRAFAFSAYREE